MDADPTGGDPPALTDRSQLFAAVARELSTADDLDGVLEQTAIHAVATIGGAQHCGITVVERGRFRTAAATGDLPRAVDQIQYDTGEGPCLEAIDSHGVYEIDDLASETRWPRFAARAAAETPARAVLAFRLHLGDRTMGGLNLYAEVADGFDEDDREVGAVFAAHAAVALAKVRSIDELREALASRDIISTAKGILMARGGVDEDEAFEILRRASRRTNTKVRDLAEQVVEDNDITPVAGPTGDRPPAHG